MLAAFESMDLEAALLICAIYTRLLIGICAHIQKYRKSLEDLASQLVVRLRRFSRFLRCFLEFC